MSEPENWRYVWSSDDIEVVKADDADKDEDEKKEIATWITKLRQWGILR
jgi:hypothetical protein